MYAFYPFFGHPWKFPKVHFSIMSPNFGVKHNTRVKNTSQLFTEAEVASGGKFTEAALAAR